MNISPINAGNSYTSTQKNNTPSFGMAWDRTSKEFYQAVVENGVADVFSKHGTRPGLLGKFAQWCEEKGVLGLADRVGKKVQRQDFLSNAHTRDFLLRPDMENIVIVDVLDIRTGRPLTRLAPKIQTVGEGQVVTGTDALKALDQLLDTSDKYLRRLESKRLEGNYQANKQMRVQIGEAKNEAAAWADEQIAKIRTRADREINKVQRSADGFVAQEIGNAHVERSGKRIQGSGLKR